jgi:hypothetical protein
MKTKSIPTTHIVSTDLKRPVKAVVKDILKTGIIVTRVLESTRNVFVHVPKGVNARVLIGIKGVTSASPDYPMGVR